MTTLQTVIQWIREGWPAAKPSDNSLSSFWINRDPLQMEQDVLLLVCETSTRVVIPQSLQQKVLSVLHSSHWGIVKTKQLARRYVW